MNGRDLASRKAPPLNPAEIREDFPILRRTIHGKPLVYLDSAATTQKPQSVIDALERFYLTECSNVHRGVHELSVKATEEFEQARLKVQRLLGAADSREIIFTGGTTESINLVAHSYGQRFVKSGDEILITEMEHHSNIVPWQLLCERSGARLRVVPINDAGELILDEFERLLNRKTRLVALTHVSNALGTRNPVERVIELAHANGSHVLLDGAQAVAHEPLNLAALGCDFFALSGHKMYGPTGIGVLYGKAELLEQLPPYQGGGDMIRSVTFAETTYNDLPNRLEAGTPNIAGVIGLGAAVDYLQGLGLERLLYLEQDLLQYATRRLTAVDGLRMIGTSMCKSSVLSFYLDGVHPHDVGTVLDGHGVAVRAGHHCAQPLMERLGVPATVRASMGCYSVQEDIDRLCEGLENVLEVFR